MATERRPYHRVADSTWSEPWGNDLLAFIARLQGAMHERWRTNRLSPGEASIIRLGKSDLCKVAGKRRLDVALKSARLAAEVVTMFVRLDGDVTVIEWPKWAEFQGLLSEHGGKRAPSSSPSASSVQRPSPEEEKEQRLPAKRGAKSECPDALSEPERFAIAAWCREKHPDLMGELGAIWDQVVIWARSHGHKRASWYATMQTFVMRRAREAKEHESTRPGGSNGRRLTAVEAGRKIAADIERRAARAESDLLAPVYALPALGDAGR